MFNYCSNLATIYASNSWSTANVTDSENMFYGCTSLVGGAGTTYDSSHTDASYAHVDEGSSNPGYLTGDGGGSSEEAQYWMELESTLQYADELYGRARDNSNVEPWMLEELSMMINRGSDMYDEHTAEEEEVRHMIEEINWICWEIEEAMNRQPEPSEGPEPYAVLSNNNTVLTFYYDDQKSARGGMDIEAYGFYPQDRAWNDQASSITSVVFDQSFANCTSITSTACWFCDFNQLEAIVNFEYLNTLNVTDMSMMFQDCYSLREINMSNFNTSNVTSFFQMFINCSRLTSLDVSGFNTENVQSMRWMFGGCSGLTSIDVSNFNTSNVTSMGEMFWGCSGLTSLDLSNFNTSNVSIIWSMFSGCSNLRTIYVSDSWDMSSVAEGQNMFSDCTNLIGGRGTQWSEDHINYDYAHIDGGSNNPGYLTDINDSPVADLHELEEAIAYAESVAERARNNSCVEPWALEELEMFIERARDVIHNPSSDPVDTTYMAEELRMRAQTVEDMICDDEGEARFDGLTAWVSGNKVLDDAFVEVGGREVAAKTIAAIVWNGNDPLTADMLSGITNPNLLVYVNEASKAPAGVQNVIVNGTASQIVLTDASGNNNFFCPEPFTAQYISYTRNFSQTTEIGVSRGWETIALPFNVQSISHGSHGALVPFGGGNGGYPFWLHQLMENGLTPVTAMEANTPYLICMPNNTVYPSAYNQAGSVTFASSNVTVPRTEPREVFGADVILMPAFQSVASGPDIFTLNVGAARDSYAEGSVFISNYSDVRPFQAYVRHSNQARGTDDIQFIPLTSIGGGDDTTAIMEIIQPAANGTGDWYSLDGRKLSSKPTQKGVYIQNGKKIVIK